MVKAGASRFCSSGGQGARAVTVVQLSASRSVSHIHDPVQCGMPVCSVENGGAGAAHFGAAVGRQRLRLCKGRSEMVLGATSRRSVSPTGRPSRCFTGAVYRAAPAQVRAHGCGEAAAHQPSCCRSSAVRGGSCCRSARAAARPAVSPRTATLTADARCARRPADALNELRPLRQRVSRAAGICLPAAAGCQRSLARRCRQSAA